MSDFDPTLALIAAADGDQRAWSDIVANYGKLVWSVARGFRLNEADAADVFQATWFRLVEHLGTIRDGNGLGSWLATTARREAINTIRRSGRETPVVDVTLHDIEMGPESAPEYTVLRGERDRALWQAFLRLPQRCQQLLRLLLADPAPSYEEAAAALDMPVGSIGPSRSRCLRSMAGLLASAG